MDFTSDNVMPYTAEYHFHQLPELSPDCKLVSVLLQHLCLPVLQKTDHAAGTILCSGVTAFCNGSNGRAAQYFTGMHKGNHGRIETPYTLFAQTVTLLLVSLSFFCCLAWVWTSPKLTFQTQMCRSFPLIKNYCSLYACGLFFFFFWKGSDWVRLKDTIKISATGASFT